MKIAQRPSTTEGIAASNSIKIPIKFLIVIGIISSVINMAAPTPKGTEINRANSDVINVERMSGMFEGCASLHHGCKPKFN